MLCLKEENAEVYYLNDIQKLLCQQDFQQLRNFAKKSKRNRARFCMHTDRNSQLHEMFEILTNEIYMRPHKQTNKHTSYHIVFGSVKIYLFDSDGKITDALSLGDYHSGQAFYFRAPKDTYRTLVPESDFVLYHEITTGPFNKHDTIFAPWSPSEHDHEKIKTFRSTLNQIKSL